MTDGRLDLYRLPEESLRSIAAGDARAPELRLLRSAQRSHLLLVLRSLVEHGGVARARPPRVGAVASAEAAWRLLAAVQRSDPGAVDAVLADPMVMAWAMRLLRRLRGVGRGAAPSAASSAAPLWADVGQLYALAAAAALRAGRDAVVGVPAHRGVVWVPGAGAVGPLSARRWSGAEVRVSAHGAVVRGEGGEVRLPRDLGESAPGWHPLPVLWDAAPWSDEPGAALCFDTVTPYRDFVVSPRAPVRMAGRRSGLWRERVAGACALLARESPADAVRLAALVRVLVPRAFAASTRGQVASSSSPDAFGAVTLSLPYDEAQMAATLVHETRHQQLNALLSLVPLVREPGAGGGRPLHYAPWRSDPRPVHGLLHGVFAFAGVTRFWRLHREFVTGDEARRADFEFAVFRDQVREVAAALLAGAELTAAGRLFVAEIAAAAEGWVKEDVMAEPARLAAHYCALRRAVWRARHLEFDGTVARRAAAAQAAGEAAPPLPGSRLRPRPDAIRTDTFGHVVRLHLGTPDEFARRWRRADAAGDVVIGAECAAVAGDADGAARRYAAWAEAAPGDVEAWIGAVLADPGRSAAGELLLGRPEAVAAVRRAAAAEGAAPPGPLELAEWLRGAVAAPGGDSGDSGWSGDSK
ncbi:aKG-HExxH-type peptide beta-hydroxylase [Streptomyces sp. AN091965]|uniref:aKG-HExxH-type peptide beta-hydroxylase n=1 Tax=Streptomyces sp. AN091965 TaxID=2927803 RepID=UPI001F600064|nr:HEXXH motif-containing putative peptide modification protein [Streptomyces sp. AN091965]MCI3932284.1 HEXXH motif-containing putative peptide modification protein [Streptomyces sp. AN091965]